MRQMQDLSAEARQSLVKRDHAMRNTMQLEVTSARALVVEEEHCAGSRREEVFERKNLTAIANRALRQQSQLGKAVEDEAGRTD